MKHLLLLFFAAWVGLVIFIIARWYRRRKSHPTGTNSSVGFEGAGSGDDSSTGGGDGDGGD